LVVPILRADPSLLRRYEGQVHTRQSYVILLVALALTVIDIWNILARIVSFIRSRQRFALKPFWNNVILGRDSDVSGGDAEYAHLVSDEPGEIMLSESKPSSPTKQVHYELEEEEDLEPNGTAEWANNVRSHRRFYSHGSEATLVRSRSHTSDETLDQVDDHKAGPKKPLLKRIASTAFDWTEKGLVLAGFSQVLLGIIIYTGAFNSSIVIGPKFTHSPSSRRLQGKLCEWMSRSYDQCVSATYCLTDQSFLTTLNRGRHLLVLRSRIICPISGRVLQAWLGLEPASHWQPLLIRVC
jgi:hypothetical protein